MPAAQLRSRYEQLLSLRNTLGYCSLVHAPRSRSSSFLWLLEEFGEPYRVQYVAIRRGDGSGTTDPSNPHPHGKVPVLIDDTAIIFEQSAIALYLADRYPRAGLGPGIDDPARCNFLTLLAYYSGVVEPAFTSKFMRVAVPRGTAGWVDSDEVMDFINARLGCSKRIGFQPYLGAYSRDRGINEGLTSS